MLREVPSQGPDPHRARATAGLAPEHVPTCLQAPQGGTNPARPKPCDAAQHRHPEPANLTFPHDLPVQRCCLVASDGLNGHSWDEIARALATSPTEARLRFDPQSPVADGRWPYDF